MFRVIRLLLLILVGFLIVWIGYEGISLGLNYREIIKLRTENPTTSSLIEGRLAEDRAEGRTEKKQMTWVSLSRISPHLQKAVLAGEDARFFEHNGFDWNAIQKAWEEAQKEAEKDAKQEGDNDPNDWIPAMPNFKRGASTITQQLAKNLFLSEQRSFLRKGREAALTSLLERELTKRRILEIYLNVIEWGDGIYGAEAASRNYFRKSASELSPNEAAYLSAMIPSPLNVFNPQKNPKRVRRRQNVILKGMNFVRLPQ